ncbi:transporter substrate-binding domain-containing protein [Salinicola avicenniae]|uniref:transporter substrate-binding domain-containing protein n=1 Tax=Salinicola avicenniae TaxID=2916836 RepID=UPI0020739ECB|nr:MULTISPECIES: transporter substrate-binding domain-containing protein [unclassified Salinicola]
MKMMMAVGVLAMLSASVMAQADTLDDVKERGVLRVGTEMQFAPFDYLENGQQSGFNKAVFEEVGKALGVEVGFVDLPWASVLPGLEADKYDMVAGPLIITQERMERYRFTAPVAESSVALLTRASDDSIHAPSDIAGKVAGGGKASAQLAALESYVETLDEPVEIREYVDNNQAYADLAARRLDAVANSLPNIAYIAKQRPSLFKVVTPSFGPQSWFAYIGRGGDESASLIDAFNAALAEMREDGRLAQLQETWIGQAMDVPDHPVPAE